jgi:hypothetical protein
VRSGVAPKLAAPCPQPSTAPAPATIRASCGSRSPPGRRATTSREESSWDEWFRAFDENGLALVYQAHTADGQESRFSKLVDRETVRTA